MDVKKVLTGNRKKCSRRVRCWTRRRKTWYDLQVGRYAMLVAYIPFRGFFLRTLRRRGASLLQVLHVWPMPELSMKRVNSQKQGPQGGATHLAAVESGVFAKLMSLVAHCCTVKYDDGEPRRPGWFTVKTQGAAWTVQVKDPDSCSQLQATAQSLDDALALADLLLGSEEAPWEPDPFLKRTQKK